MQLVPSRPWLLSSDWVASSKLVLTWGCSPFLPPRSLLTHPFSLGCTRHTKSLVLGVSEHQPTQDISTSCQLSPLPVSVNSHSRSSKLQPLKASLLLGYLVRIAPPSLVHQGICRMQYPRKYPKRCLGRVRA